MYDKKRKKMMGGGMYGMKRKKAMKGGVQKVDNIMDGNASARREYDAGGLVAKAMDVQKPN
jgi:hypothetical protein